MGMVELETSLTICWNFIESVAAFNFGVVWANKISVSVMKFSQCALRNLVYDFLFHGGSSLKMNFMVMCK